MNLGSKKFKRGNNYQLSIINYQLLIVSSFLWVHCAPPAGAQVDSHVDTTGVLKVGIRQNVLPLGGFELGQRQGGKWMGYCADIAEALAEHLSRHRTNPIQVVFITSTTQSRFSLVAAGTVDLECGPNTVSPEAVSTYGVSFSTPFFVTATQILSLPTHASASALGLPLGVIKGTTNEADLSLVYPRSQIDNSFVDYEQGINAVLDGEISGFASDGILLVGSARRFRLQLDRDYTLSTLTNGDGVPFCARYAMILPGGAENGRWRQIVNSFLSTHPEARTVWRRWFSHLDTSIEEMSAACG